MKKKNKSSVGRGLLFFVVISALLASMIVSVGVFGFYLFK